MPILNFERVNFKILGGRGGGGAVNKFTCNFSNLYFFLLAPMENSKSWGGHDPPKPQRGSVLVLIQLQEIILIKLNVIKTYFVV